MFCDACGAVLQPGQGYCTRCGKQVIGPVIAESGRVARHAHLLGILWIAYSAISVIGGVVLMVVANTIFEPHFWAAPGMPPGPPPFVHNFLHPLLTVIALALLAKGGCGVAAGFGLMQRSPWARTLAIVVGIISLLNLPFGTAIGIYTLWVLMSPNADVEYEALGRAAGA